MSDSIIFSVTTYNRSAIAIQSINDLIAKTRGDKIYIDDDGSDDIILLRYLIELTSDDPNKFFAISTSENYGVDYNNSNRLIDWQDEIDQNQYVYLTDSDMIYSSQFYKQLMAAKEVLESNKDIFAISLFSLNHTGTHPVKWHYTNNPNYNVKSSFGGCSVLIKYSEFKQSMEFYQFEKYDGKQGWDWALCHYAHNQNRTLLATSLSFVQHIGEEGVNSSPMCFDSAINFVP